MTNRKSAALASLVLFAAGLGGSLLASCADEGPAEEAGKKGDQAADTAANDAQEAADQTEE